MNHRTKVEFDWNCEFLMDTDKLPALIKLLEDCTPVDSAYIDGERVDYVRDVEIIRRYGPAPKVLYKTQAQVEEMREEQRRREEEERAQKEEMVDEG